jgi:predicted kinase
MAEPEEALGHWYDAGNTDEHDLASEGASADRRRAAPHEEAGEILREWSAQADGRFALHPRARSILWPPEVRDALESSTRLVLICGLPASGKSTLARQLAPKIPAIRLDKDGWATQLGADLWDEEFRVRLEHQLWVLSQDLLARGQSVILEWGHWARVERDEKRLGARALGVGVELHYLDAPLEELIERAERRNASGEWTASPMTRAHFERWATIFQPPDDEEILLFDKPVAEG